MSRVCPLTGKKPTSGNNRSHSLRATRRRWGVNLQKVKLTEKPIVFPQELCVHYVRLTKNVAVAAEAR